MVNAECRALLFLVVLSGCSSPATKPAAAGSSHDALYASSVEELRKGNLDRALALADQGMSGTLDRPGSEEAVRFRLLKGEVLLFRRSPADAARFIAEPIPDTPRFAPLRARQTQLQGQREMVEGRLEPAIAVFEGAADAAKSAHALDVALDADVMRGQALVRSGQSAAGVALLERAAAQAAAAGDAYRQITALHNRGMASLVRGRFDEAVPYFDRVLSFKQFESYTVHDTALTNAALCYARLGDFDRAVSALQIAIERHEKRGSKVYLGQALGELGSTYVLQGDFEKAIPYLQRAIQVAREAGRSDDVALQSGNLASAYMELKRWDEAERVNVEARRAPGDARNQPYPTLFEARILEGRGRFDEAVRAYREAATLGRDDPQVQWRVSARLGLIAYSKGEPQAAVKHFDHAVAVVERARQELSDRNLRISIQMRLSDVYLQYTDLLVSVGQLERALSIADSGRARVLAERQGARTPPRVEPAALRRLASRMASVMLVYSLGESRSFAWVVTPGAIRMATLPASQRDIATLVADYRRLIVEGAVDPLPVAQSPGDKLYDALVAPVAQWIPAGSRVVIVPDGPLGRLNFESLPVTSGRPRYWIEDVEIAVAPSLGTLAATAAPPAAARDLLLIGDASSAAPQYPALRFASAEMGSISKAFDGRASVVRGPSASPASYLTADVKKFGFVHFTAHAEANPGSPLDSAVILSPGGGSYKLYASDVLERPLTADLVTISACRSAGERTYAGEGLVGFAWAFLRAGATRVIAGLWDVDDRSTAQLMERLYLALAKGASPSTALREAKLAAVRGRGADAKPYYWAPFELFVGAGVVP